jgi:hypothetical protein
MPNEMPLPSDERRVSNSVVERFEIFESSATAVSLISGFVINT